MLRWVGRKYMEMQEAREENRRNGEMGFTLIELLVVVIIIGVLAAIAIPVFLNQREQAFGSTVQSDVRNGAATATAFAADNNGVYTGIDATVLQAAPYEWNLSDGVTNATAAPAGAGDTGFTLSAQHTGANPSEDVCTFTSATGQIVCN